MAAWDRVIGMIFSGVSRFGLLLAGARGRAVLLVAAAVAAMSAGVATASVAAPRVARSLRLAPRSELSLSGAPAGLRAAVRRTLGARIASGAWSQQAKLTASDPAEDDVFGDTVAISGKTAVVGAPFHNSDAGAAYVFMRSGKTWSQQAELTASDGAANDEFGSSVAISGRIVVVGAPSKHSFTGAAYVFSRSGKAWSQQAELTASDAVKQEEFGNSVGISGTTAVVGAPFGNTLTGPGAAYVFSRSGSTWSQQAELTASDAAAGDLFGASVAIYGSTALVGAYFHNSGTGAAYVFLRSGKAWSQQAELTASGPADFGFSVAIQGSTAVVGAVFGQNPSNTGAAYVFVRSGNVWSRQAKLTGAGTFFGYSVAISGKIVVVGSPFKNMQTGAAYVFVPSGKTWSKQAELTASDAAEFEDFGFSVGISGTTAVVGAPGGSPTGIAAGAAYAFAR